MDKEKAIVLLECSANELRETLAEVAVVEGAAEQLQKYIDAYEMGIAALREQKTPCAACGYGGKHLEAPPCTTCPAYPKLENTLKLLESNGDRFRAWSDEEWADRLLRAARSCDEAAVVLHGLWCDDQGACVADGQCDDDRVRACVLRWLKAPARGKKWTDL